MVTEARPSRPLVRRVTDMLALSRPSVWITSLLPFCLGYVLATHRFVPATCVPLTDACVSDIRPFVTGIIVRGPLAWLSVLAINDAVDLPGDLRNPRKSTRPLPSGRLSPHAARVLAYSAAPVTLAIAFTVGPAMAALTFGWLVLGWMYSVPPLRLKTRPGWDVATNAVAVGGFALVAGWTVARPLGEFPWIMAVLGIVVGSSLYLPTTLADYDADLASGDNTVGVRLGRHRTHVIGLIAMAVACAIAITLSALDYVFPQRQLWVQVAAAPILICSYHFLLRGARTQTAVIRSSVLLTLIFSALNVVFALVYVGWL